MSPPDPPVSPPPPLLLSVDWDAYSAVRPLVFDAPIWGTADRAADRTERWEERARSRDPQARDFSALAGDYPLLGRPDDLRRYRGRPVYALWSHAHLLPLLERWAAERGPLPVLSVDSHHDLFSGSGNPAAPRPGNWAGLALARGMVSRLTVRYPPWHAGLPVAEGFDLARTAEELRAALPPALLSRLTLERSAELPPPEAVGAVVLVQSPSWCSPAHDPALLELLNTLSATPITAPRSRTFGERPRWDSLPPALL